MSGLVQVRTAGQVTRLALCRPEKGNSLSRDMVQAMADAIARCHADGTTLLVLEAQGRNFCTGFDLGGLDQETDDSLMARFVRIELLLQALHAAPFLTVALGHGRHIGAGADLFAACQRRVLTGDGSFRFPGAAFGLVLGTGRLARLVGATRAGDWAGSGRQVQQDEAQATGLVWRSVEASGAEALIGELARESARLDPPTRHALYTAAGHGRHAAQDLQALVLSAARPGLRERIRNFRAASAKR